ncbi:helix-turn-helix domain-containing protein [Bacillaceae bacterium S4-13-56]
MEQTLRITNVLSDPTRFYIYQYITKRHSEVTVQEVADAFEIHPNVARLHLSKLEDVDMLVSETKKTGKGGRPSRLYRLSDEVVQLNFPYRDYQLLSKIAIQSFVELGPLGRDALYQTGKRFGKEIIDQDHSGHTESPHLSIEKKINIIKDASTMLGLFPEFTYREKENKISFKIFNCPFKEVAHHNQEEVCKMHGYFIKGMFESLIGEIELTEEDNLINGCEACSYEVLLAT